MATMGRSLLLGSLFLVVALGCANPKGNVAASISGKVTCKGSPVTAGSVVFLTADGTPYGAPISADGTYAASDLPVGPLSVMIETESANTGAKKAQTYGGKMKMSPVPPGMEKTGGAYMKIPGKYADPKTSGFSVTLKAGQQTQNFELAD